MTWKEPAIQPILHNSKQNNRSKLPRHQAAAHRFSFPHKSAGFLNWIESNPYANLIFQGKRSCFYIKCSNLFPLDRGPPERCAAKCAFAQFCANYVSAPVHKRPAYPTPSCASRSLMHWQARARWLALISSAVSVSPVTRAVTKSRCSCTES